jgi:penicillin amidase
MNVVRFFISLVITLALIYLLDHGWKIGSAPVPPLGRFLDPYHGFWQNIESKNKKTENELSVSGLKAPVKVIFDSLGIPHIFASNDEDLYFAQGYITATHRLWQMEFQTHAAAGRVSEILSGEAILNYDRTQRRLGMVYGAKHALQFMEEDSTMRKVIGSYSAGINAYINSLDYKTLPFEYKLLDYEPEQWAPIKCALFLKNMEQTLNIGDKDMEMTNALKLFGKAYVDVLYPDDEGVGDPIVENPGGWNFKPLTLDTLPLVVPPEYIPQEPVRVRKRVIADPTVGSNNWAVSGSKTVTHSPILCNDPHLRLSLPSLWYVIQLNAPGVNVMGASLPGSPFVVSGFNDSIAWGITNAQRDLVDWFKITYENERKEKYLLDGKWVNTEKVVEEFKIKGAPSFYDTVTYTRWGPVTYDKNFEGKDNLNDYAFRWIAHDKSEEVLALYKLNRAKNHAEYIDAISHFFSPAQNFVFASVAGDIAIKVQGKFPVRRPNEGKFVLDGSKTSSGWQAFIPNDQNIAQKNPARGFVSSANQYPADKTYPYYITSTSYEAYRNRRINQVLASSDSLSVEDMMKLQGDNYNLKAAESLPYFLSQLDSSKLNTAESAAWKILKAWNYFNDAQLEAPSYYEAWWDNLMPLLWDEMKNEEVMLKRPTAYQTIKLLKEQPALSLFDIQETDSTEDAGDVIRKAFADAILDIEKWKASHSDTVRWADYKDSYIGHLLPPMKALSIKVKTGGNHDIVNAHSQTNGPSWRMIVSLEKTGVKAWAAYPGGQSGNPGSKFYSNLLDRWTKVQYYPLLFIRKTEADQQRAALIIKPE